MEKLLFKEFVQVNRTMCEMPYGGGLGFVLVSEKDTPARAAQKINDNLKALSEALLTNAEAQHADRARLEEYKTSVDGLGRLLQLAGAAHKP